MCFCGRESEAVHHLIFGQGLRKLADQDGLAVPVCHHCHTLALHTQDRLHDNPRAEDLSKMLGQMIFERNQVAQGKTIEEAHEEFMYRYGRVLYMSRPKYYWYGIAKKMAVRYYKYKDAPASKQEITFKAAIEKALAETEKLPDGALRVKAVEDILFKNLKTYEGVANDLHYDWRTIQNWVNKFVNCVGRKAGY